MWMRCALVKCALFFNKHTDNTLLANYFNWTLIEYWDVVVDVEVSVVVVVRYNGNTIELICIHFISYLSNGHRHSINYFGLKKEANSALVGIFRQLFKRKVPLCASKSVFRFDRFWPICNVIDSIFGNHLGFTTHSLQTTCL